MNITKTTWDDAHIRQSGAVNLPTEPCVTKEDQPSFGLSIFWNEPAKWWKPAIAIYFWHWHVQVGWLFDFPDGYKYLSPSLNENR